jgi:signal transduction histidine kinase
MVMALDEIVWAVNPKNDDLGSLATYFSQFTEHFVRLTPLRCRFEIPEALPRLPLNAEQRHSLFLAFKEALQNAVKHAAASSLRVSITVAGCTRDGAGIRIVPNIDKRESRVRFRLRWTERQT